MANKGVTGVVGNAILFSYRYKICMFSYNILNVGLKIISTWKGDCKGYSNHFSEGNLCSLDSL